MEAPVISKRGYLNVRYVLGKLHVQLNLHPCGSAVLLPLRPHQSDYPGDISLRRITEEVEFTWVNLRDLHICNQNKLKDPVHLERFNDLDLKDFHCSTARGFATNNRCALLQSTLDGTEKSCYTLRLGAVDGGLLAVPVTELQFLEGGDLDLGAIVFHPQDTAKVVREHPGTQNVSKQLDDWKFHHILDPLMKAAVPFEEIKYRDPDNNDRRPLW